MTLILSAIANITESFPTSSSLFSSNQNLVQARWSLHKLEIKSQCRKEQLNENLRQGVLLLWSLWNEMWVILCYLVPILRSLLRDPCNFLQTIHLYKLQMKNSVKFVKRSNSWLGWSTKWDNKPDPAAVWYSPSRAYNKSYDLGRTDFKEKGERGSDKTDNILPSGSHTFVSAMGKKTTSNQW